MPKNNPEYFSKLDMRRITVWLYDGIITWLHGNQFVAVIDRKLRIFFVAFANGAFMVVSAELQLTRCLKNDQTHVFFGSKHLDNTSNFLVLRDVKIRYSSNESGHTHKCLDHASLWGRV